MTAGGGMGNRGGGGRKPGVLTGLEFATIGIEFTAVLLVLGLGGAWLDRRIGTSPLFLIAGMLAGAMGGIYSMYRRLTRRTAQRSRPDEAGGG